ncbi:MAG: glycosyltransferase family 4 protein [Oscillospiraceae bacterium]|nr:glycosyltransferase family 4 protein [Oscillospiraceae bacterium]
MKILFAATVTEHINSFHLPYLKYFKDRGCEVHVATYGGEEILYCDKKYNIAVRRSPFRLDNIKAYFQLKKIIESEKYDLIHCHTPMGGLLGRLCGRKQRKKGMKILYTAHGFHFYKGAPLINWLLYYPMEKICSYITDGLVTINHEDYALAKKKMRAKKIYYIPGIGVDTAKFSKPAKDRETIRKELGIPKDATILISVGELNKNKNHQIIIRAMSRIKSNQLYYIICGTGSMNGELKALSERLRVDKRVILPGFRKDIADLLNISDIFVFPSMREGLGLAAIEAMSAGLPIITSNIHGINDYSEDGVTGYSVNPKDVDGFASAIDSLAKDKDLRKKMGGYNKGAVKKFDLANVMEKMRKIYEEV